MRNQFSALCFEAFHNMQATGGFTINLQGPVTKGYAVAQGGTSKFPADSMTAQTLETLLFKRYGDFLRAGGTVGAWVHKGEVWVECSEVYEHKEEALTDAYKAGEIAIYDLANKTEIKVGG